jgi:uncharacterized protein (TIGR03067 family)
MLFRRILLAFAAACGLALAASPASALRQDEKAKKDLDALQGEWVMHALEINGKDVPPKQIADTYLIIKGDGYTTKVKSREPPGFRIKLDPSKDPREIDMIVSEPGSPDKVYKGIYKIEKDTFKMCRGASPEKERPTQFATWPETNYFVVTWKKK